MKKAHAIVEGAPKAQTKIMADPKDAMADVAPETVTSHIQVTYIVHHSFLNMVDMVAVQKVLTVVFKENTGPKLWWAS